MTRGTPVRLVLRIDPGPELGFAALPAHHQLIWPDFSHILAQSPHKQDEGASSPLETVAGPDGVNGPPCQVGSIHQHQTFRHCLSLIQSIAALRGTLLSLVAPLEDRKSVV